MTLHRILAIDVGAGTQDILLWEEGQPMENNIKLVLPSWTTLLARQVRQATQAGRPLFLTGNLMGGGPLVWALKDHLEAGYPVYITPRAALTIRDNLAQVRALGFTIVDEPPALSEPVTLVTRDVDLNALTQALAPFGVTLPETIAVAVQDHGECLEGSNRRFRFQLWEEFVRTGGALERLVFREVPSHYTRMRAVQQDIPQAILMDTGPAALWGVLQDPHVAAHQSEGLIAVNVGNHHTVAVLLQNERILGLFEHHTMMLTPAKLHHLIVRLRQATLTNQEVFEDHGHGACFDPSYRPGKGFEFVAMTGPQRQRMAELGYYFAAPYGDMMLTGCFGLIAAARRLVENA